MLARFLPAFLVGLIALALVPAADAAGLPLAKKTLVFKSKAVDISVEYPQTGNKAVDTALAAYARKSADDFKTFEPDFSAGDRQYTLETTYDVERNDGRMLGILFTEYTDTGGAHPNTNYTTFNFTLPGGADVQLPEIVDGKRGLQRVSQLTIAELIRTIGTGAESMSDKDTITAGAGPSAANFRTFIWLPKSLHLHFAPYAVAAYAAGPQEATIPLSQLQGYIRSDWHRPQPSFDCAKAAAPLEHAICSDIALARLDRDLADKYNEKMTYTDNKDQLRQQQRDWLATRAKICGGGNAVPCLTKLYRDRLAAMDKG
jgi:uncharacterized protein YecT (DUF1311 family)